MPTTSEPNLTPPAAADDPLARLHKMSTTAGVASQQYVAINNPAVVASLLGLASALALLSPILLIVPAAGIVVSWVAWRQISNSNGTETGKPLAAVGLLLSMLLGGGILTRELAARAHDHAQAREMDSHVTQLAAALKSGDYDAAYRLFTTAFRERVPLDTFKARWQLYQQPDAYGPLQSMTWNGVLPQYETTADTVDAFIYVAVKYQRSDGRYQFNFRKAGDAWLIHNIPEVFPIERPTARR